MKRADYEKIADGTYWGRIPDFKGLWANEPTLEACRNELQSTLEDWLLLALWENETESLPVLGKLSLRPAHGSGIKARARKAS